METNQANELNAWLRTGGRVITASDRAARAILTAYHHGRRTEGAAAWAAPDVLAWNTFVRTEWEQRSWDGRLILNPMQEEALWDDVIQHNGHNAALLEGPRRRLAGLAADAHGLLCQYAPQLLESTVRSTWQQDAGAFSQWLSALDEQCRANAVVSANRIGVELMAQLEEDTAQRPRLLLAGFDRLTPTQQKILSAWGSFDVLKASATAADVQFYTAADAQHELAACAAWCGLQLAENPEARLLVIAQDAQLRRGEIERAFLQEATRNPNARHEFSLGIPLGAVAITRSAHLLLRWLNGALEEHEMDWLFSTHYIGDRAETTALQSHHRTLRRRGLERTRWALDAFLHQPMAQAVPLAVWKQRMLSAQSQLRTVARRALSPLDWTTIVPKLLAAAGWPGTQPLSSAEHQALRRWEQALDTCASLGYDGRRMQWQEFLTELGHALRTVLFTPESEDAPILIAGPAESAGLTADAIWFLGADEEAWPARGAMHPLLPSSVQRTANMPHATAQTDAALAQSMTERILTSAPLIRFSYARQKEGVETRPSRMMAQLAGETQPLPSELAQQQNTVPRTIRIVDKSRVPLQPDASGEVPGGSTVLTSQSQCPFKAFAVARLDARGWEPAEAGLSAAVRGQLLHAVLSAVWSGPPHGIRTLDELLRIADLGAFVAGHAHEAISSTLSAAAREQMPARYLELEEERLTKLVTEWLKYESSRLSFLVEDVEQDSTISIAGLTLKLRLDRVDRLNDGSMLVMDYKTGDVSTKQWELPRPEDVQLPLYAGFALPEEEVPGGLVFAKLRAGAISLEGYIGDAAGTMFSGLKGSSSLVKNALTLEQLEGWRSYIEQLARNFLDGDADVDPREFPKTCERCGLQTICRVHELNTLTKSEQESIDEER